MEVIVLKGAALAKTVYGDIGLRPMGDIGLLVKREDLPRAEKIMSGAGYHFDVKNIEWNKENHYHISYIHPDRNIPVEIHWHISQKSHPFRIRNIGPNIIEGWWERAQTTEFSGSNALVLCPEDLFFHLCLHFFKHRFYSQRGGFNGGFNSKGALIQLCDIFQTIKHYRDEMNWIALMYKAERYGIEGLVYTTLSILREISGNHDDIFHHVSGFPSEGLDKELLRLIHKRILIREDDFTSIPGPIIQPQVAHTFHEKVKTLLKYVFPNPEAISKRYSVPLSSKRLYLYYMTFGHYYFI